MADGGLRDSARHDAAHQKRLGDILQARGYASAQDVEASLQAQNLSKMRLGHIMASRGLVSSHAVASAIADQKGMLYADLANTYEAIPNAAPLDPCLTHRVLPLRREGRRVLLATSSPDEGETVETAFREAGLEPELALAPPEDIRRGLAQAYGPELAARAATRRPELQSQRQRAAGWQKKALIGLGIITAISTLVSPEGMLRVAFYTAAAIISTNGALWAWAIIAAACGAWKEGGGKPSKAEQEGPPPRVSIMIALYKEPETAPLLIKSLRALDYPPELLDVKLVLEADDDETPAALLAQNPPGFVELLVTPDGAPRTKPRALNFALDFTDGEIVGVYDAEDKPPPDQIRRIVAQFAAADPDVVCIQARLGWYNRDENWLTRCFEIEYASWFDVMLPGLKWLGLPMPLGGTSLFLRREAIVALGGWDSHNVTEDADLGMLISRAGWRTELSRSLTAEEASCQVEPWIKQRSRWLKGYLATWSTQMRDPAALLRESGWKKVIGINILLLSGVMGYLLLLPVLWLIAAMWWITNAESWAQPETIQALATLNWVIWITLPILFVAAVIGAVRRNWTRGLVWIVTLPLYWPLGSIAACIAIWELMVSPFSWRKTRHGVSDIARRLNEEAQEEREAADRASQNG